MSSRMHEGEFEIDAALVQGLLAGQFPELAGLPLAEVRSTGTVNAIYRLGERHCVRLPRLPGSTDLGKERRLLPELAPHLPLRIPAPVASGRPTDAYPEPWAVYDWIEGRPYSDELVDDEVRAATTLAEFVLALRRVEPGPAVPPAGRRPLPELNDETRSALRAAGDLIDGAAAETAWQQALQAPLWTGGPVWIHADLLRPNVLVANGSLTAVIDFGGAGAGDPATDLIAAWSIFGPVGRAAFRVVLGVDDGTWARARGIALHQAAGIIPYYRKSNPGFVRPALRTVEQVLLDLG